MRITNPASIAFAVLLIFAATVRSDDQGIPAASAQSARPLAIQPNQGYDEALKSRVLLGVDRDGDMNQQCESLYDLPKRESHHLTAWAGTEGMILKLLPEGWYIEVPRSAIQGDDNPLSAAEQFRGWLLAPEKLTAWDVLQHRTKNRKESDVTVVLACSSRTVVSGGELEVVATFTNTSGEVRTVHFGRICLRNTLTAAPLSNLGPANHEEITQDIEPHTTGKITVRLVPTVSKSDSIGSHQLYLLYAVRKGPQGPVPVPMVSELVEVTIAPTAPPATTSELAGIPSASSAVTAVRKAHPLEGVVIEKRTNVKSFEAWNAPSDPYYALDIGDVTETYKSGDKTWQQIRKRHVTLRPSSTVSTADLAALKGKRVALRGRHTEGEPYKPSGHAEQFPMQPTLRTKPDGEPEIVGWQPANCGVGFVVEEIIKKDVEVSRQSSDARDDNAR